MRTGGDDIAQAFALMGIKPCWAAGSQRVVDFEIMPSMLMNRPTSMLPYECLAFRDAFPNVIALFDAAVSALAQFDEWGKPIPSEKILKKINNTMSTMAPKTRLAGRHASYRVWQ